MPTLTFNWNPLPFIPIDGHYVGANWINVVMWRDATDNSMSSGPGLYVVIQNAIPVYAGKANNIAQRFNGRSDTLHELNIRVANAAGLAQIAVYTMSVSSSRRPDPNRIALAESWLIRALFRRDALPHQLQNIDKTNPFIAPADGLNIRFTAAGAPAWLTDSPGYNGAYAGGLGGYNYGPGAVVLA